MKSSNDNTLLFVGLFVLIVAIIALIVYYTRPGETKTPEQTSDTTKLKIEDLSFERTLNPDPSVDAGDGVSGYTIEPYGVEYEGKVDYKELSQNVTFTMNWKNAPGFTGVVKGFKIEHFVKPDTPEGADPDKKQDLIKKPIESGDETIKIVDFGRSSAKIVSVGTGDNAYSVIGQNSFKLYAVVQEVNKTFDWEDKSTQKFVELYDGRNESDTDATALKISKNQLSATLSMTEPETLKYTPAPPEDTSTRAVISKTTYNVTNNKASLNIGGVGVYLTTIAGAAAAGKQFYFTYEDGTFLRDDLTKGNVTGTNGRTKFKFEIVDKEGSVGKIRQVSSETDESKKKYLTSDDTTLKLYTQTDENLTAINFAGFDWTFNKRISGALPFPTGESGTGGDVVCIYGDDAFIGQPYHSSNTGRVLIYKRNSTGKWDYKKTINSSISGTTPAQGREFGCSVSISKDYAVIGEKNSPGLGNKQNVGRVYIVQRGADGNWVTSADSGVMSPSIVKGYNANELFGSSVAISDPILPQNKSFLVVGVPGDSNSRGKISLYQLSKYENGAISWTRVAVKQGKATATGGERFGDAVDISSDRVIVGVPNSNKVFIYEINPNATGTTNSNFLGPPGIITGQSKSGDTNVNFGISVAIQDDVAVVGAPGYNAKKGVVYVFKRGTTTNTADDNGEGGGWRMNASGLNNFGNADIPGEQEKMNGYTEARIDGTGNEEFGKAIGISGNKLIIGSGISNKVRVYTRKQKTPSSRHRWNDVNCVNVDNCNSLTKARVFEPPPKRYNESDLKFGTAVSIDGDYAMIGEPGRKVGGAAGKVGATYITTV